MTTGKAIAASRAASWGALPAALPAVSPRLLAALGTTTRILCGTFGAYAVAALLAAAAALLLPIPRAEAVTTGTLLSLPAMLGAAIWAFGAATPLRAASGLGGAVAILGLLIMAGGAAA